MEVFDKSSKRSKKRAAKMVKKARTKTHQQTMEKLTYFEAGRRRIISDPPLLVPIQEWGLDKYYSQDDLRQIEKPAIDSFWPLEQVEHKRFDAGNDDRDSDSEMKKSHEDEYVTHCEPQSILDRE